MGLYIAQTSLSLDLRQRRMSVAVELCQDRYSYKHYVMENIYLDQRRI